MMRFEMEGATNLTRILRQMPVSVNRKAINKTARRAGRHVVKAARSNTKKVTGNLYRSIGVGSLKAGKERGGVWVGARVKGKMGKGYHAHLYAYGFVNHRGGKRVEGKGNWIGKAAEQVSGQVYNELNTAFISDLNGVISKYKRRL